MTWQPLKAVVTTEADFAAHVEASTMIDFGYAIAHIIAMGIDGEP
jgi:hypothetical protein